MFYGWFMHYATVPTLLQSLVKMTMVMVGSNSVVSREQIFLRKTVNICFVTWPPFTGNVSLNEAYNFHESKQD